MSKKIRIINKNEIKAALYFILHDKRSDKDCHVVDHNTIVVSDSIAKLLHEIGVIFLEQEGDYRSSG